MKKLFLILISAWILCCIPMAEATTLYATHSDGELNIRREPNLHTYKVGYLEPGDAVEYRGQCGEWISVKLGIEEGGGWVHADYLSSDPQAAGLYMNCSNGRLRKRAVPGGRLIGWLQKDAAVQVYGILPDESGTLWARTADGYVQLQWLQRLEDGYEH